MEENVRNLLRKQLSAARRQLSNTQVIDYSSAICSNVLPLVEPFTHIAGYLAFGNEVRIDSALKTVRHRRCKTFVPIIKENHQMVFARIDDDTRLVKNSFGILEPDPANAQPVCAATLDAVLVPLVGFDEHCHRMGMGGGFYDRAFAARKESPDSNAIPLLIGVAYDVQQTSDVMPDWWDVPLDIVVTETRILRRNRTKP